MRIKNNTIFVTGIDTDIGKTYVTGLLAKYINDNISDSVITQKMIQSGVNSFSEISPDILIHREIMDISPNEFDKDKTTCPISFKYPASPHLSAELENKKVDISKIEEATAKLNSTFDYTIVEGIGGLLVPVNDELTVADYIQKNKYPVVLVSSPRLGSINHTLLSLEALKSRGVEILALVYKETEMNEDDDRVIYNDSLKVFRKYLDKFGYKGTKIIEIPFFDVDNKDEIRNVLKEFKDLLK